MSKTLKRCLLFLLLSICLIGVVVIIYSISRNNSGNETVEVTQGVEDIVVTSKISNDEVTDLKKKRDERRGIKASKLGDIVDSGQYATSGTGVTAGTDNTTDEELNIFAPYVDWTDYALTFSELTGVLKVISIRLEDKLSNEDDLYYVETEIVGDEQGLSNFDTNVAYYVNEDMTLSLNCKVTYYNLTSQEKDEEYRVITVRWNPYELEIVE